IRWGGLLRPYPACRVEGLRMTIRFDGKTALVTAAAQGIGRASALAFAEAGAKVYATDINMDALQEIEGVSGIVTRKLDVLDEAAVNALVAEIGQVDILFNCAGVVHGGSILDMKYVDLVFCDNHNVKAVTRPIRSCLSGL